MLPDSDIRPLFDAVAEALIMVDATDPNTLAELSARVSDVGILFEGELSDDHPYAAIVLAVERLGQGDECALADIERAFGACRRTAESRPPSTSRPKGAPDLPRSSGMSAQPSMPLADDVELLHDFAIRSAEHLDDADERLLCLENETIDPDAVDAVFRAFHTIKGMAGFLALDTIAELAHESESLLVEARHSGAAVSDENVRALFSAVDRMRDLVAQSAGDAPDPAEPRITDASPPSGARVAAGQVTPQALAASARAGTVRVDEARLDALLDAIGEMVIAQSMVSASTRNDTDAAVLRLQVERLDKITRELQHMATSLRMVPLRATFRRMARVVHDVADKAGKQVEFVVSGEDTELDKVVVDRIADPLIHALRNAVDHGIETPAERRASGKPESGRVELHASHAGGAIQVQVVDDGRGIDAERVEAKARERGLIGDGDALDERSRLDLVFAPGFSTIETVTDVSGRGVGMDVVKRTVEELRGRVDLRSRPGEGTSLEIRLPLTLAIIDGMILRVGDERYVLPLISIERSVRPTAEQVVSVVGRGRMLALDDGLVPVVSLGDVFSSPHAESDPTQAVVVIVNDNGARAGLLACELLGQQQTVIKPLGEGLPEQPGIAGGAIMPDGRVGLILDAAGLVRTAHLAGGE